MNNLEKYNFTLKSDNFLDKAFHEIDLLDLDPISETLQRPSPDGSGFDAKTIKIVLEEYRRFLKLNAKYPDKRIVPNRLVDNVWHTHILDTRKYASDCVKIFSYFLHHSPYFGQRGDTKLWNISFNETELLYQQEFGESPLKALANRISNKPAGCDAADIQPAGCDAADIRYQDLTPSLPIKDIVSHH